jgi:ABC-type multidrug transport system fused ATPase/permease subunit
MIKKILNLFTFQEKKRFFLLLILILIMGFLDVLGVASIFPFVAILVNPELINNNSILFYFYQESRIFGVTNSKEFIFFLGIIVFVLLIFSLVIKALTIYAQVRFSLMREYSIGKRLIEGYLYKPYTWFLHQHGTDLTKNILSEVGFVVSQSILPMLNLISQIVVVLAFLILLIFTDPTITFIIGLTLISSYVIIFYFVKKKLFLIGSERLDSNSGRFLHATEAFNSIKEVKIRGLEQTYISRFENSAKTFARSQSLAQVIALLPRFAIEGIAFGGMIILVLVLIERGQDFIIIAPIISLYALAGYRLLPALQQAYTAFTQIKFSVWGLERIHKDLMSMEFFYKTKDTVPSMEFKNSIKLTNIYFTYPNSSQTTLKNINLTIPAFTKIGIVGTTGSGKTTLVDLILGLLDATQGAVSVDENIITFANKVSWQKNIGYVPQQIYLKDSTLASNVAFGVDVININQEALEQAAKIAKLHEFITKELPNQYNTIIGEGGVRLSGGQRQRIGIARALYQKPKLLILDEATNALDNLTEQAVMEEINNLGNEITVIIIAHRLSTVKKCDTIFFLEKGVLKDQGTYEQLSKSNLTFQKMS